MPTCDIYLRLSDARIEEALSGREAKLRALAADLGWPVHRVVVENDLAPGSKDGKLSPASAFKRRRIKVVTASGKIKTELRTVRPGFRSVLEDISAGRVNAVLAEDLDRLIRQPRDGEDLLDAVELAGATARSLSGSLKLTDGGTSDERYMARIMAATATKSSEDTARRVREKREVLNGSSYQGGPRPYGYVHAQDTAKYHKTLIMVPDEANVLRAAAADILDRDISLRAVARDLRERGVPNTTGTASWSSQSLKHVLLKPAIAGLAVHKGVQRPAPWPHILERDVWERLKDKLTDPARRTSDRGNEPRWLLSGIGLCGGCDDGTTVRATGARDRTFYTCREGYHLKRNARYADAHVEASIVARLSQPDAKEILRPPPRKGTDTARLRGEAATLRQRKTRQMQLHAAGAIDDTDLADGLRALRDRLDVVNAQLAVSDQPDPLAEFRDVPATTAWPRLPLSRKRTITRKLATVTFLPVIKRGPGFDEDSVRVEFKH